MEAEIWRGRPPNNGVSSYKNQSVLILNQNSAPCAADKCDSLLGLLQKSLHVKCIQEQSATRPPDRLSSVPDLILLRPAAADTAHELIASCKEKWRGASIFALLCARWDRLLDNLPSFLTRVDDFLSCPFQEAELLLRVRRLLQPKGSKVSSSKKPGVSEELHFGAHYQPLILKTETGLPELKTYRNGHVSSMIGNSLAIWKVKAYLRKVAMADSHVLITGETGTGKELAAKYIHQHSARRAKLLVVINCAALPDGLLESELFGYERGAFTGAVSSYPGKLKLADGGAVLFDEIGEMSPYAQAKILRVIETKQVYPLGGRHSVPVNIRIMAATNRDLDEEMASNRFRPDLYFRLNVARIKLPPLRERQEDIPLLIDHFARTFGAEFGREIEGFTDEAMEFLKDNDWPGNIRELMNMVERIFIDPPAAKISISDLPESIRSLRPHLHDTAPAERELLLYTLSQTNWNKSRAAERLNWSRMTLYRKMAKYRIDESTGQILEPLTAPHSRNNLAPRVTKV